MAIRQQNWQVFDGGFLSIQKTPPYFSFLSGQNIGRFRIADYRDNDPLKIADFGFRIRITIPWSRRLQTFSILERNKRIKLKTFKCIKFTSLWECKTKGNKERDSKRKSKKRNTIGRGFSAKSSWYYILLYFSSCNLGCFG